MSWLSTRTDGELVDLVAGGDRRARALLVDRSLVPASQVAMWLEADRDRAIDALIGAYSDVFRRLPELEDRDMFLPALLLRLDAASPFPLDPATMAPLDPIDRDRVRAAVVGTSGATRRVPALAATLAAVAALALGVSVLGPSDDAPASTPREGSTVDDADVVRVPIVPEPPAAQAHESPSPDTSPTAVPDEASEATTPSEEPSETITELAETL